METAFRMQTAATDAFDIAREPSEGPRRVRSRHFANGCLLPAASPSAASAFVQVYYGNGQPWDTHRNHNELDAQPLPRHRPSPWPPS